MVRRRVAAKDVAQVLLYFQAIDKHVNNVTNIKLQKLLYYAQVVSIVKFGNELFPEELEAWTYGPNVPSVYKEYSIHGNNPIQVEQNYNDVRKIIKKMALEQLEAILIAWGRYAKLSPAQLVRLSCSEKPWSNAYLNGLRKIDREDIRKSYKLERER